MLYRTPLLRYASALVVAALVSACTQAVPSPVGTALAAPAATAVETRPRITVHRDAYCGCCHLWVEHLREEGFEVDDRIESDMGAVKQRLGVAPKHASCHTAEVGGYVVEGHVPASDIRRLLEERPRVRGLVLPGMPVGSPGMEVEGSMPRPTPCSRSIKMERRPFTHGTGHESLKRMRPPEGGRTGSRFAHLTLA